MKSYYVGIIIIVIVVSVILVTHQNNKSEIMINNNTIMVDVANTPQQRQRGLSGKKSLCQNCGMLFIFDTVDMREFWMPNMFFDIDIVWIRNNIIVDVSEYVSHKKPTTITKSQYPVDMVLELPAGRSQELGIITGHGVQYIQ